jgi:hypothetical protein
VLFLQEYKWTKFFLGKPLTLSSVLFADSDDNVELLRRCLKPDVLNRFTSAVNHIANTDGTDGDALSLFWFVYRDFPRQIRTKLKSTDEVQVSMGEYFEEFPDTLEALILMMFQTVPDYLKKLKENTNKAIEAQRVARLSIGNEQENIENRRESFMSSSSRNELERKKGGRPANKESFLVDIFERYKKEVRKRREFHHQPDESVRKDKYDDWVKRRDEGEFILNEEFYKKALKSLNQLNQEELKRSFSCVVNVQTMTSAVDNQGSRAESLSSEDEDSVHSQMVSDKYNDQRPSKVQRCDPLGSLDEIKSIIARRRFH